MKEPLEPFSCILFVYIFIVSHEDKSLWSRMTVFLQIQKHVDQPRVRLRSVIWSVLKSRSLIIMRNRFLHYDRWFCF